MSDTATVDASEWFKGEAAQRVLTMLRKEKPIYDDLDMREDEPLITRLQKAREPTDGVTNQERSKFGQPVEHPYDLATVKRLKLFNVHHSTCLEAKASSIFMGWKDEKVATTLDPLCDVDFYALMGQVGADYVATANGFIEVVSVAGQARGLHHIPSEDVHVVLEVDDEGMFTGYMHYEVLSADASSGSKIFAAYGDKEGLFQRSQTEDVDGVSEDIDRISEVIHIRRPNAQSPYYGVPSWLSSTAGIELVQAMTQHYFDFFLNRGVPEFMLFLLGGVVNKKEWERLETAMQGNIGLGNAFKSLALNLPNPAIKVQLEKLAMESKAENLFPEVNDTMALQIVSAHQVPPLLAGIVIPGKLGANNELPNALMAFQVLTVGPEQRNVCSTLASTLGNQTIDRGLSLDPKVFLGSKEDKGIGMHKITEEIDLGTMDTVGRMREPLASANAKGRDPQEGLKD